MSGNAANPKFRQTQSGQNGRRTAPKESVNFNCSQILANPSISVGGRQQGWLAFTVLYSTRRYAYDAGGAPALKVGANCQSGYMR